MRISDWSSDVCSSDLEDDGTALEDVLVAGTAEIALAKGGADHRRLHDRGVEEVAAEHPEACLFHQRIVVGADDVAIGRDGRPVQLAHGLPGDGERVLVELAGAA